MSDYDGNNITYVILFFFLIVIVGVAFTVRFMKYKKDHPNQDRTTTEEIETTTTKEIDKLIFMTNLSTFTSYTSSRGDINSISLKDKSFDEIEIPDILTYCESGEEYTDSKGNTITFTCDANKTSASLVINKVVRLNTVLNQDNTVKVAVYKNDKYYIVYNVPANGLLGNITVYNGGTIVLTDSIINHTGTKDKAPAIPFIQDNIVYYISPVAVEEFNGYNCEIKYIDFNKQAKSDAFIKYSCNP